MNHTDDARAAAEAVLEQHEPLETENPSGETWDRCSICDTGWPCDAARMATEVAAQARQIERLEKAVDFAIEILGHIDVASREPQSAAPDFLRENMRICGDVARKAMPTLRAARAASDEGDDG